MSPNKSLHWLFDPMLIFFAISISACTSLPDDFSGYQSDSEFVKTVSTYNAPLLLPPKLVNKSLDSGINVSGAFYQDLGGRPNRGYGKVNPDSRLSNSINKYCADSGGANVAATHVSKRTVMGCSLPGRSFISIHQTVLGPAGKDTGKRYTPYNYISIYNLGTSWTKAALYQIVQDYVSFEKKNLRSDYLNFTPIDELGLTNAISQTAKNL